jgi:prophage regulatory protein
MSQNKDVITNQPYDLLRLFGVENKTGLKKSLIYQMIQDKEFPSPIKIGKRSSAWIASEIDQWIEQRIKKSGHKKRG